jgi:hypothetical protein
MNGLDARKVMNKAKIEQNVCSLFKPLRFYKNKIFKIPPKVSGGMRFLMKAVTLLFLMISAFLNIIANLERRTSLHHPLFKKAK